MKKIFIVSIFLFSLAQITFAQLNEREINDLRRQIKISDKDPVRVNEGAGLTSANSVKIFLFVKRNGDEKKYFEKWIKEWNEKDGDKHGKLEQVNNILQADIVLTQFITTRGKLVEETGLRIGNIPRDGQLKQKPTVGASVGYTSLKLPVYSYLIKRDNGIWTIIYGSVETAIADEQLFNPEFRLWRTFSEKMKNR